MVQRKSALASHFTSAEAWTSQPPLHATDTMPGLTSTSHLAAALSCASTSTLHCAGSIFSE